MFNQRADPGKRDRQYEMGGQLSTVRIGVFRVHKAELVRRLNVSRKDSLDARNLYIAYYDGDAPEFKT